MKQLNWRLILSMILLAACWGSIYAAWQVVKHRKPSTIEQHK